MFLFAFAPPAPSPDPSPAGAAADSVWQSPEVVAAFIAAVIGLIGLVAGVIQWKKSQGAQRRLDRERADYEDRLARDRADGEADRLRREAAEEAERSRRETTEAAAAYKVELVSELKALRVLDMARPLDLRALYVQVRIREDESRRYVADEEIEALAAGRPAELLRATAERTVAKHADAVAPEEALSRYQRVVIVGDPGAGKTTMLKHLAFRIARDESNTLSGTPIFVELRRFIDSGLDDILEFAVRECVHRYGFTGAGEYLRERLDQGDVTLLLDGLDEVLGGSDAEQARDAYRKVAAEIERVCSRHPRTPIAVTCRRAGFNGGLDRFQVLEVLDFTWEQSRLFLGNWFTGRDRELRDLVSSLGGNVRMKTLAANPLILSLIAIVYENDLEIPERRSELYHRCLDVLLKEWDSRRGIRRYARFTTDRKRDLLEELAWHFHVRGQRYFPEPEVLDMIRDFLPTIGLDDADPAEILREIAANYGLLREQAAGWYGFWHLTIQEYLAAVWANEHFAEARDHVLRYRHDPWWEEVLLLLAGRMSDATDLLLGIAGSPGRQAAPRVPIVAGDDILCRDLLLLGHCLLAAPRIKMAGLRAGIVDSLWVAFTERDEGYVIEESSRILVGLSASRVRAFFGEETTALNYQCKIAMARALGEYGEEATVVALADEVALDSWTMIPESIIRGMHDRGISAARRIATEVLDSAMAPDRITALSSLLCECLKVLSDTDGKAAVRYVRALTPYIVELNASKDLRRKLPAVQMLSGIAYVAMHHGHREYLDLLDRFLERGIPPVGEEDPWVAVVALNRPGDEAATIDTVLALTPFVTPEAISRVTEFWTESLQVAAIDRFVTLAGQSCWWIYNLLAGLPARPELLRKAIDELHFGDPDKRDALVTLLARGGDGQASRDLRASFRRQFTADSFNGYLLVRQVHTLVDLGLTDSVLAEVRAALARAASSGDLDAVVFARWAGLVPRTQLDAMAGLLWPIFERLGPGLLRTDPRRYAETIRVITCRATAARVMALEFPDGPDLGSVVSALGNVVDAELLPTFVEFWRRLDLDHGFFRDETLTLVLLRLNHRLYADGRLVPAVESAPA
ncbi:NACHT domain-containing protein [Actinoplanes subglobosus]|uniref:NACHT domain-containing protein n=1 Tax=Actinoplanes subglobosus TaxID=1547892 RepID=A0ABV8J2I3_9ACTN